MLETEPNYVFVIEVAPQGIEETDRMGEKALFCSCFFLFSGFDFFFFYMYQMKKLKKK